MMIVVIDRDDDDDDAIVSLLSLVLFRWSGRSLLRAPYLPFFLAFLSEGSNLTGKGHN